VNKQLYEFEVEDEELWMETNGYKKNGKLDLEAIHKDLNQRITVGSVIVVDGKLITFGDSFNLNKQIFKDLTQGNLLLHKDVAVSLRTSADGVKHVQDVMQGKILEGIKIKGWEYINA
jgi:hypothetical protein